MEPWTLENGVPSGEIGTFPTYYLFEFSGGAKAAETARNVFAVYRDNDIGESTAWKWFSRFKEGRYHISDTPHSGKSSGFHEDSLNTLNHNDPCQCTRELGNVMNCDHSIIVRLLHSMSKVKKSGVWVQHALSQFHKNKRVTICASLLTLNRLACWQHRRILSCIFTGYEKWCLYANTRKMK